MMEAFNIIGNNINDAINSMFNNFEINSTKRKPKNFDKYRSEIAKTKAYIKSKREAFYRNNNLKER